MVDDPRSISMENLENLANRTRPGFRTVSVPGKSGEKDTGTTHVLLFQGNPGPGRHAVAQMPSLRACSRSARRSAASFYAQARGDSLVRTAIGALQRSMMPGMPPGFSMKMRIS